MPSAESGLPAVWELNARLADAEFVRMVAPEIPQQPVEMGDVYEVAGVAILATMVDREPTPSLRRGAHAVLAQSQPGDSVLRLARKTRLAQQKLLTESTDGELAALYRQGDADAGQTLVDRHTGFIREKAHVFKPALRRRPALDNEDLLQRGAIKILSDARWFDPVGVTRKKDMSILSYGGDSIIGVMRRQVDEASLVRLPDHVRGMLRAIRHNAQRLADRTPPMSLEEIAERFEIPVEKNEFSGFGANAAKITLALTAQRLLWWQSLADYAQALDTGHTPHMGAAWELETHEHDRVQAYSLTDTGDPLDPQEITERKMLRPKIREVLRGLPHDDQVLLQYRFGIRLVEDVRLGPLPHEEAAGLLGIITREDLLRREARILRNLRNPNSDNAMDPDLDGS